MALRSRASGTSVLALLALLALSASSTVSSAASSGCTITPTQLTVDFLTSPPVPPTGSPALASFLPRVSDSSSPLLGWWVSAAAPSSSSSAPYLGQSAYRIVAASSPALLPPSGNPDIWDSGVVASNQSVAVPYTGPLLPARTRVFWSVAIWDGAGNACGFAASPSAWEVPLLTDADWEGAQWITRDPQPHAPPTNCEMYGDDPAPLFRRPFTLAQPAANVLRARLYIAGLGYFIPSLDGQQVGDEVLAPGWTDFNTSVLYSTHDVTASLTAQGGGSSHVLGIALGAGWWDLVPLLFWGARDFRAALPTGDPMTRALLTIDYADGSTQTVTTAPGAAGGWTVGPSELLFNSIYLGNRVDRRLEPVGWDTPSYVANTSVWVAPNAAITAGLGALASQRVPPVRKQTPIPTLQDLPASQGERTIDLGRQMAGICSFCFASSSALSGLGVNFRYGELLYPNGTVNGMTSVAGQVKNGNGGQCAPQIAFQEDHYTLRGDAGSECFTPRFTWHSARYVMVTGDAAAVAALSLSTTTCYPLRSDVAVTGSFTSSSPLFNAIHEASVNTAACNMMSIQSDCPHRYVLQICDSAYLALPSLALSLSPSLPLLTRPHTEKGWATAAML
jgi:alpha-L-rhamnosidase